MIHATKQRLKHLAKQFGGPVVARRQPRRLDLPASTWGLTTGSNGTMWHQSIDLAEVAARFGTPLHLVDADALARNATEALGGPDREPRTDVFYSYKTNPVPAVLRRLHDLGVGAEVISPYELWLARRLGVPAERIIYNGPAKSPESLRQAIELGLLLVNANSASEAKIIASVAEDVGKPVNLGLRVALQGMWAGQFGLVSTAPAMTETVRQGISDPNVNLRALHVHRGLTIRDRPTLAAFLDSVLLHCDQLRAATGWHPEILDIGGSLACPTVAPIPPRQYRLNRALGSDLLPPDPATCITLSAAASTAATMITEHFGDVGLPVPLVVQEPGRALTGNTQMLLTSVVDVKDDGDLAHAVLDAGMNVAEPVVGEYHQLFSVTAPSAEATTPYRLVGPICTPADILYYNWRLPALRPGHVLAVMDAGAYFVPFATSFSFPRAAIVMLEAGTVSLCRRAESFDDLVALDDQAWRAE